MKNPEHFDLLLRDGEVASGGYHVDYGCGIRVLKGEKTGYAYAETTDYPSLLAAAKAAGAIANTKGVPPLSDFCCTKVPGPAGPLMRTSLRSTCHASTAANAVTAAAAPGNTATLGTLRGGTASGAQRWGPTEEDVFGDRLQRSAGKRSPGRQFSGPGCVLGVKIV